MQRILDLLLSEVKVSVITREKNRPDLQATHGRYRAAAGTPARVAYERDRQPNMPPTPDGKPYAEYAASRQPRVKKDGAEVSSAEAAKTIERQRGVKTSKPVSQAARSAMGGKPVTKNQAVNIMNRKRSDLMRGGALRRATPGGRPLPVMTSKPIKDHTEYFDRLTSLLIENSAQRRKFRNAEIKAKKEELGQPLKKKGHSKFRSAPEGTQPAGETEMNTDDYEPGTTERNQAKDIAGKQAAAARNRKKAARKRPEKPAHNIAQTLDQFKRSMGDHNEAAARATLGALGRRRPK